jgi:hypothetical protein
MDLQVDGTICTGPVTARILDVGEIAVKPRVYIFLSAFITNVTALFQTKPSNPESDGVSWTSLIKFTVAERSNESSY